MTDPLNMFDYDGRLLSALIDPQYTPREVAQYFLEVARAFPQLGAVVPGVWEEPGVAVIKEVGVPLSIPEIKISGDAEILDMNIGVPLYRPGKPEAQEWAAAFMSPEKFPVFPIQLGLTRNIHFESPYFILSLDINPGTWGCRYRQYSAIEKVYGVLQEEGQSAEAGVLARQLEVWERQEVDFPRIRRELWLAAKQLLQRFSAVERVFVEEIPDYAPDTFEHAVWINQFDWWNDNANCKRAIAYWVDRKTTVEWDRFFSACIGGIKGTWPGLVKILEEPPVGPTDMERLTSFLQDMNWPGAGEAYMVLIRLGKIALPFVDEAIKEAERTNDDFWLDSLQSVRENLMRGDVKEH